MTSKEIQTKAKVWRLVGDLGHEESLRRLTNYKKLNKNEDLKDTINKIRKPTY